MLHFADVALVISTTGVYMSEVVQRPTAANLMDMTRTAGWIGESNLGPRMRIGDEKRAEELVDWGSTAYAHDILGAAARLLEVTVEYAQVRHQFGRPIGSFQAVKHRSADMLVDIEAIRSACYFAATSLCNDTPDASLAASIAKSWSGDAGQRVAAHALQIHGGIGFTWEHDLHLFLKRVHLDSVVFGDTRWHRRRVNELSSRASASRNSCLFLRCWRERPKKLVRRGSAEGFTHGHDLDG